MLTKLSDALRILMDAHLVALAIVNLTPTPKDNTAYGKVYKVIEALAGFVTPLAKQR
jgi:hypothetical protein